MGGVCCVFRGLAGSWTRVKIHLPLGHLLLSHCSVLARMPGVSTEGRGPDQASLFTQVITLPPGPVLSLSVQFSHSVVSNSLRPHRQKPTRLPRPWDSPGKNTGVGCHFLLQCRKRKVQGKSLSRVRLCATPERAAHQATPSLGFSKQEHWSGLPFPSPVHESEK